MRGCLVCTVLGMKARQRPCGSQGLCYPPHSAHCSPSHTVPVNCSFQTAACWHPLSPCVLAQGLWQSPSSSSGELHGVPSPLWNGGAMTLIQASGGPHWSPTLQQPQGFWWAVGVMCRLLQLLLFLLLLGDVGFVSPVLS